MNTITPRLRNSSMNGNRFTIVVDAAVEAHLTELNNILGVAAFNENANAQNTNAFPLEEMKKKLNDARDEANMLAKEADSTEQLAQEAEHALEVATKELNRIYEDLLKARAESPDKDKKAELKDHQAAVSDARKEAVTRRKKSNTASLKLRDAKENVEGLSQQLVKAAMGAADAGVMNNGSMQFNLELALKKPIFAKKTESDKWDNRGIINLILANEKAGSLSISDCIDMVNQLSNLKNDFQNCLNQKWNSLTPNQKAVFDSGYKNIADYLLAYGYFVKGITEVNAMFNFMINHKNGTAAIIDYAVISTVRTYIQKNALKISTVNGNTYNDDDHPLIKKMKLSSIEMEEGAFTKEITKIIKSHIANGQELKLIEKGLVDLKMKPNDIPDEYYPKLVQQIRNSPVTIDEDNVAYFLAAFINNIKGEALPEDEEVTDDETVLDQSEEDFDVNFTEDTKTVIKTSLLNIKASAQLFTSAIMEMDLDIFGLANYLTESYLIKNRVNLEDKRLRDNLELFVFSNKFTKVEKSGKHKLIERTKAGDRLHFYRQVFNISNSPLPQGVIVNTKFSKLWKNLIPTVKKYLDERSSSLTSDSFVSKGGVMQLVSGLQINLSANCTSMAMVMSPSISAEWNFIKDKILGHPEIVKQIAPTLGSWKGVAETLYSSMKHRNTDATLVYQKSQLCYKIINIVAHYDAHVFEQEENFLEFCSTVIQLDDLTQSIASELAEENEDIDTEDSDKTKMNGADTKQIGKTQLAAHAGNDEWDF